MEHGQCCLNMLQLCSFRFRSLINQLMMTAYKTCANMMRRIVIQSCFSVCVRSCSATCKFEKVSVIKDFGSDDVIILILIKCSE